ncbi:hypothetical protein [Cellulophaga sp. L1A9]|uniref:hypothetical protein n=1 Tax=Cellulophaga sp. L1A9 TaxID=2686362 RepID=UPI00131CDCE4|nr:hypothetical protein [Cellulophaga sp. L1A9]
MKKTLVLLLVLSSGLASAQAYREYNQNQELKFNIGLFLASTTVEGSYEYFLNEDTSIGGTIYFDNTPLNYNGDFGIGPNFRAYFGYAPRSGFFAEAFGLYYSGEVEDPNYESSSYIERYNTAAIGIGLGHKFATYTQKFTLEFNAGLGRNVNPQEYQNTFMYRAGVSVGFRF